MPYGAKEAIKALVRSCRETDMLAGCIMLAKYHEKELAKIAGEAEIKRLHAWLCEPVPYEDTAKMCGKFSKICGFGFEIGGTASRGKFEVKFKSARQDGLKI